MRWQKPLAAAVVLTALTTTLTASATPVPQGGACSSDATLLGFSDALDKTTYDGQPVAGLSALNVTGPHSAVALVDNVATTPARVFDLKVNSKPTSVQVDGMTILRRPDGTPYNGGDFDGEGLVVERGNRTILATSEREPSIRRFRLSDGQQIGQLPVPARFQVAPAGEATSNATFESLAASRDGLSLYAGMEGPLASDGTDADNRTRNRIIRYFGLPGTRLPVGRAVRLQAGPWTCAGRARVGEPDRTGVDGADVHAGLREHDPRVHGVAAAATDITKVASLTDAPSSVFLQKKLLFDLVDCPPSGAAAKHPQPNPLLDNVEALALGGYLPGGRRQLYLMSDDNNGATQITRLYSLAVDLH